MVLAIVRSKLHGSLQTAMNHEPWQEIYCIKGNFCRTSELTNKCPECGLVMDRDANCAMAVLFDLWKIT